MDNEKDRLDYVIEQHMRKILNQCNWNKSKAALILGVDRRMLQRHVHKWMKEYNKRKNKK